MYLYCVYLLKYKINKKKEKKTWVLLGGLVLKAKKEQFQVVL